MIENILKGNYLTENYNFLLGFIATKEKGCIIVGSKPKSNFMY
jgi:hypothetical protein